jgi:hypothetical protein
MNLWGALYRVDIVPGGSGSLTTILPSSCGSHSDPSFLMIRTRKCRLNDMINDDLLNDIFSLRHLRFKIEK